MLKEVIEYLAPKPGGYYIDCTLGGGGYTKELAKKISPEGKILAIDLDEMAVENFRILNADLRFNNVIISQGNFKNLLEIVKKYFRDFTEFDGIIFDLGLSSAQLEDRSRGFSFNLADAPLRMNFGEPINETAENIINSWGAKDLAKIFKDYGEEKFAHKIASAIAAKRQLKRITAGGQLVKIITDALPIRLLSAKIHPATKIFQALRITVNQELENLRSVLPQAIGLLKPGGKLAVVSYHSLEDRIVKRYFKQESRDCLCPPSYPICQCGHRAKLKVLTAKIIKPSSREILNNPRARSAKLRVAGKL